MWHYIYDRLGERSTHWGFAICLLMIVGSFFVPLERADIADAMRALAIPIAAGLFFWRDKKDD